MKKTLCRGLIACVSLVALASCQDYEGGFDLDQVKKAEYAKNFEKTFGTPDPNQDWSMATLVKANVNLPGLSGTAKMNICTGDPRNAETRLLAQIMLKDGQGSIDFDAVKGADNVFVTVEQDGQYKLFGKYQINQGILELGEIKKDFTRSGVGSVSEVATFSASCPTTQSTAANGTTTITKLTFETSEIIGYTIPGQAPISKTYAEWEEFTKTSETAANRKNNNNTPFTTESLLNFDEDGNGVSYKDPSEWVLKEGILDYHKPAHPQLQYLTKVEQAPAPAWNLGFGSSLFNEGGVFEESVPYYSASKVALYGDNDLTTMEKGFVIETTGGPIELPFIFGNTAYANQFGYIYWKDGEDPLLKKHFVLMEDARPSSNIYWGEWHGTAVTDEGLNMKNMSGLNYAHTHRNDDFICYCPTDHESWCAIRYCYCTNPEVNGHSATCNYGKNCTCPYSTTGIIATGHHTERCYDPMANYFAEANKQIVGTTYRVMFFGEDGNATTGTYDFPAGYHVAFWIDKLGSASDLTNHSGYEENNFNYSLPELNERLGSMHYNTKHVTPEGPKGIVKCISWSLDGNTYLGFGDNSGDEDLNDIVFIVSGNFTTTTLVEVAPIKWHMNYNGQHDTTDNDLYARQDIGIGKSYGLPSGTPVNQNKKFIGWSTTPTGASGILPASFSATAPEGGMCYYAIWEDDKVDIKWHINADGTHHENDDDLFDSFRVDVGDTYGQPSGEPTNGGKEFLGWSTTPDNSSNDLSKTVSAEAPEGGKCYYAIWKDVTPTRDPDPITWIFACEDLGGTFDYDFNDIVWEVRHDGTSGKVQARLLAAGGTLPFFLRYDGKEICSKASVYGANNVSQVYISRGSDWYDVLTADGWSISDNSNKFSVVVKIEDEGTTTSTIITGPTTGTPNNASASKNPEVILVPGDWEWPEEGVCIKDAYKDFTNWVFSKDMTGWANSKQSGKTITRQQSEIK